MTNHLKFYFSFRSPYSWLAMYRINFLRDELPVELQLIPVIPPKDKENFILSDEDKVRYIVKDVNRIASAYGLDIKWPEPFDTDWVLVHSAYLYAVEQSKGIPFCLAVYRSRFIEGKNVGDESVLRDASAVCGLDADILIEAHVTRKYKKILLQGLKSAGEEGIFGVPYFVYNNSAFWGNDRLEWLLRDINENSGLVIPDLSNDPFTRPY